MKLNKFLAISLSLVLCAFLVLTLQHYVVNAKSAFYTANASIGDLKTLPNDTPVDISGDAVTYAPRNSSLARSTSHFYIADPKGLPSIRVEDGPLGSDTVSVNDLVSFSGNMKTSDTTGERYIELSSAPIPGGSKVIKPVIVSTKTLHNDGSIPAVLVRTVGTVKQISVAEKWFALADGYAKSGVAVDTKVLVENDQSLGVIAVGDTATVTGIVSLEGASPSTAKRVILLTALQVRQGEYPLSGKVTNSLTTTGINGATVYLSQTPGAAANPLYTITTDASGNYSKVLPRGTWYVAVSASGYATPTEQAVALSKPGTGNINFALNPVFLVSGRVTNLLGTAVSGAQVFIGTTSNPVTNPTYTLTTDASGNYSKTLTNGTWYIAVTATNYVTSLTQTVVVNSAAVPNVNFVLTPVVPRTSDLLFSAVNTNFPASGSNVGNWSTSVPTGGLFYPIGSPKVDAVNGTKWAAVTRASMNGFRFRRDGTTEAYSTAIPVNGVSIVTVIKPVRSGDTDNWKSIVDIFYDRACLVTNNGTGVVGVRRNGTANWSTAAVPDGQTTVVSLVCQSNGTYKVWANGTQIMNITTTSAMTSIVPNVIGPYACYINLGRNNPDGWSTYNGNIGDTYCYKVALTDAERQSLESIITAKFRASSTTYTITASAGAGGTISPSGSTVVCAEADKTYTITPNVGYGIQGVTADGVSKGAVSTYTFSDIIANHTIAATFYVLPTAAVSGRVINSSGTGIPGAKVYFSPTANASVSPVHTFTADASGYYSGSVPTATWRVCASASGYYTSLDISFTVTGGALPDITLLASGRNIPAMESLLFSCITDMLPDNNSGVPLLTGIWSCHHPKGMTMDVLNSPQIEMIGTMKWEKNICTEYDGYRSGQYTTSIPCNGVSAVAVVRPIRSTTGTDWTAIVSLLHDRLVLGMRNNTGEVVVYRNGTRYNTGVMIPEDQTILSVVVQSTGTFKVWKDGTQIYSSAATSAMTSLVPYVSSASADRLQIGRSIDNWSTFNGNIGDVFAYKVALTDVERQQLEADITARYGAGIHAIAGKVTAASGGAAIGGATVYFSDSPNPSADPTYTVITDASGNYRKYIADGTWYVAAGAANYITSVDQTVVLNGATQSSINFALALIPTYAISGKVTDQNGVAISGAKVYVKSSPNAPVSPNYTLTTDSSGNFSQAVINGTWYVTAFAAGYSTPAELTIAVNGAAVPNTNFTLTLIPTFTVSGRVTDPVGVAISGATVYFNNVPNASVNPVYTVTTDSSGNYSKLIPNGAWYAAAIASTYSLSSDQTIVVADAPITGVNFTLYSQSVAGIKTGPYLQAVTENSIYVLAESDSASPVMIEWGISNGYGAKSYTETTSTTTASPVTYIHKVKIVGLQANTTYHYRISQSGGTPSTDYTFTTSAKPGTNFRFAFLADFRENTTIHNQISALVKTAAPRFSLYGGDLCLDSSYNAFKNEFFVTNELDLDTSVPFFNSPGNHEGWSANTQAFTRAPDSTSGTQAYYSFDYGDVHFLMVNNYTNYSVGSAQYNWAAADLAASNKPWKVVWFHNPAYCAGGHGEDATMVAWSQNLFVPNKVDLVLTGHTHFYQHNFVNGIHHFVVGSVGAPLYDTATATYTIMSAKSYCYAIIDATQTSLAFKAYNETGASLETLNLTKQFKVSGKVSNSGGTGIYNAVVAAGGAYSGIAPVVTDSSGNYTLNLPGPGAYEIYADGPGYSASFSNVTLSVSGTVTNNVTLTSTVESGVYNGGFETVNGSLPDGWEMFIQKPSDGLDYFGNAWPDKADMYSFSRSTTANTFASGVASAKIATAGALASYSILRFDRSTINSNQSTGMTDTTVSDSTQSWGTNAYGGGTWFAQMCHGGNDRDILPTMAGDYRISSNTANTLTFAAGSNLVTNGYAVGDRYRFLREVRNYWYSGGIRTASARRIAVDRSKVYNFYLKQKTSYSGTESEKCHIYALVWRDSLGAEIARNEWRWQPGTSFAQSPPRLFLSPPVGATTVEAWVYTNCVDNGNASWSDTSYLDDLVIDPVSTTAVGDVKSLADGAHVVLPADPTSLAPRDVAAERYTNYFYISEPDGSSGTRVQSSYARMDDLNVNDIVGISGVVGTASTGEKYVKANIAGAVTPGRGATPATLSVASALADADALGRFVAVTAQVSSIASDRSYFNITSSGSTIKVNSVGYPLVAGFAYVGDSIKVNGVVSKEGAVRVILMMNYSKQTTAWPNNDITWLAVSDTHYASSWATRPLHKQRIAAMNALPGTAYPSGVAGVVGEIRGVTITGDVTDDGSVAAAFPLFAQDFGLNGQNELRFPVYEGLGNHDGGVNSYTADGIKARNPFRPDVVNISADSLNYSWDWGRVHFIQLNEAGSYLYRENLEWVKADLAANVGTSGRPVVLLQHLGFDGWSLAFYSRGEAKKLYDAVCSYNVIAVLWGHTGGYDQYKWGGIDVFGCDGPMEQFHVFHVTPTELIVTRRKWDNGTWISWTFRKNITGM